jgi:cytoskeletal protein CcmA (bactofilin family)
VPGQKSVLASDLRINGIVATEGTLEVNGVIEGEIAADSLLIGHEGEVGGKVRAGQTELRGKLTGEIASTRLTLRAAAHMEADATCEELVIESGAHVEGHFARPAPEPVPAPAPAPAVAEPAAQPAPAAGTATT